MFKESGQSWGSSKGCLRFPGGVKPSQLHPPPQLPPGCLRVICGFTALKSEAMLLEQREEKILAAKYLGRRP